MWKVAEWVVVKAVALAVAMVDSKALHVVVQWVAQMAAMMVHSSVVTVVGKRAELMAGVMVSVKVPVKAGAWVTKKAHQKVVKMAADLVDEKVLSKAEH